MGSRQPKHRTNLGDVQQNSDSQMVTTKALFSRVADVLFQIIMNGDMGAVLNLRLVDKSTYETIRSLEPHICLWFMHLYNINAFAPLITLNPQTDGQRPLSVHTLPRFIYRQHTASQLARRIIPSVWGPYIDDGNPEMDSKAELELAQTLERGLHVLFHFADACHDTDMRRVKVEDKSATYGPARRLALAWASDLYNGLLEHGSQSTTLDKDLDHIYAALECGHVEAEIGRKRLRLRSFLGEQSEIDFHTALRMLRELMERMLLRHGRKDWHRDAKNEYSLISWFILKQSPRTLAKLFLVLKTNVVVWMTRLLMVATKSVALRMPSTVTGRSGRMTSRCDVAIATVDATSGAGA